MQVNRAEFLRGNPEISAKMSRSNCQSRQKIVIGVHNLPLVYVIRDTRDVSRIKHFSALLANQTYFTKYGSVEEEMIGLTNHDHPLFRNDEGNICNRMEHGLLGSAYALVIVSFQ